MWQLYATPWRNEDDVGEQSRKIRFWFFMLTCTIWSCPDLREERWGMYAWLILTLHLISEEVLYISLCDLLVTKKKKITLWYFLHRIYFLLEEVGAWTLLKALTPLAFVSWLWDIRLNGASVTALSWVPYSSISICLSGMAGAIYIKGVAVTKYKRWGMVNDACGTLLWSFSRKNVFCFL